MPWDEVVKLIKWFSFDFHEYLCFIVSRPIQKGDVTPDSLSSSFHAISREFFFNIYKLPLINIVVRMC